MDDLKITPLFIIKKTGFVLRKRFFLKRRLRFSELINLFSDNLWKFIPARKVKAVYCFLNSLVDRILWL